MNSIWAQKRKKSKLTGIIIEENPRFHHPSLPFVWSCIWMWDVEGTSRWQTGALHFSLLFLFMVPQSFCPVLLTLFEPAAQHPLPVFVFFFFFCPSVFCSSLFLGELTICSVGNQGFRPRLLESTPTWIDIRHSNAGGNQLGSCSNPGMGSSFRERNQEARGLRTFAL